MYSPEKDKLIDIGLILYDQAYSIFEYCMAASDFCIQHIGECVVFGGTNRVVWCPRSGWRAEKHYCTSRFYERYQQYWKKHTL